MLSIFPKLFFVRAGHDLPHVACLRPDGERSPAAFAGGVAAPRSPLQGLGAGAEGVLVAALAGALHEAGTSMGP